MSKPLQKYLI